MLASLGLGGDGDEIWAINDVEDSFGIVLDVTDAPTWRTVGNVWTSLLKELPADAVDDRETWRRFCAAIARETDVDPTTIAPETRLLGRYGLIDIIRQWFGRSTAR